MNSIVCLTRGYKSNEGYTTLVLRNQAIEKFFGNKYPLLFFHEGNISNRQQEYIKSCTGRSMDLQFHDISDRWPGGYEGMCRFNMWDLWDVCQHYEMILRIDEDCVITEMATDPFELMGDNVYLKSCYWAESHSETNATLPQVIEDLTGVPRSLFYDDNKFVYTNVGMARPAFFRTGRVGAMLKAIAFNPEQRKQRWGDLPVLGSLLNIYGVGRVGTLVGMKYKHLSHDVEITCG